MSEPPPAETPPAEEPEPDVARVAPLPQPRSPLPVFVGLFFVVLMLDAVVSLAQGGWNPSVLRLVFGPCLVAGSVTIVWILLRDLRAGRRLHAVVGLVVLAAVFVWISSGSLVRAMLFPGARQPLPKAGTTLESGARVIGYTTADGIALRGLFVPGFAAAPRPVLVYFHGNAECAAWNEEIAWLFARQGLDVFVAEFRGYGGCAGSPHEAGLLADGRAALAAVERELGVSPQDVVLAGRSLGTGVAAALAGEGHGRALVLLSPYTSITHMASEMVPAPIAWLAVRDSFDSRARLAGGSQPILVVHGTADRVIPYAFGAALVESLPESRVRFVSLDGVGHNDLFDRAAHTIVRETVRLVKGAR